MLAGDHRDWGKMGRGDQEWRLQVLTAGDTLRQERLTRDLHDNLQKAEGITVRLVEGSGIPDAGHKGGMAGDVALWVAVTAVGQQSARVLVTLIKEWGARERHRAVELTYRGDSVSITGRPDEAQKRLIDEFLERVDRKNDAQ